MPVLRVAVTDYTISGLGSLIQIKFQRPKVSRLAGPSVAFRVASGYAHGVSLLNRILGSILDRAARADAQTDSRQSANDPKADIGFKA